jgi:fibronectin type 3 domain-containing protein
MVELARLNAVLSYSDVNVSTGIRYDYAVSAITSVGEGSKSSIVEAVPGTPISVPSEPRSLSVKLGDRSVFLNWSAPQSSGNSFVTNYTIYRGFNPDTMTAHAMLGGELTHTDTGLTNGQRYYYKVAASNVIGEGPTSEIIDAVPIAPSVPSPPHSLSLFAGDGFVLLNWSAPLDDGHSDITGYRIYRGTDIANMSFIASLGTAKSYMDTGLSNQMEYHYRMAAVNAVGEGMSTGVISATPIAPPIEDVNIPKFDDPDSTTGGWSLNSTLVTVAVLAIALAGAFIYMRNPQGKSGGVDGLKAEKPDMGIDDEADGDAPNKEREDD